MKPPKGRWNTINRYRLIEEHLAGEAVEPVQNYDLLSMIVLCLGGPEAEHYEGVIRMLDVLLSRKTSEAEKRKILRDDYDIRMTQTMEQEVSVMCNLSEGIMEEGIAIGMEQGIVKGMAKGMEQGILSSIKSLMETMGWTIEQAMTALKVPETDRQVYQNLLKKQS